MEKSLPETVKVEKVGGISVGSDVESARIEWGMGKNDVVVLLAIRFIMDEVLSSTSMRMIWSLFRKSDADPPASILMADTFGNSDIVAGGGIAYPLLTGVAATLNTMSEDFLFPYPMMLIRPSQFLVQGNVASINWGAYLYYLIERVTDETLAKLMVKDHA